MEDRHSKRVASRDRGEEVGPGSDMISHLRMGSSHAQGSERAAPGRSPLRTCIACRSKNEQGSYFRVGRTQDASIALWSGTGRSAYICRRPECLKSAFEKGRLERALKGPVRGESREALYVELVCKLR